MSLKIFSLLVCACAVSALPQEIHHLTQQQQQQQQMQLGSSISQSQATSFKQEDEVDYNSLGQYKNMVRATLDILPVLSELFDQLTPDAAALRSGDPFDTNRLKGIIMAFIPVTRQVMMATARAEGRSVQKEVLDRLDAMEKTLPSAFDFMANVRQTDFHGIGEDYNYFNKKTVTWDHDGRKIEPKPVQVPVEYNPDRFSGSIVSMPNQKPFFINHPPKELFEAN